MSNSEQIVSIAKTYIGKKEISGNKGFLDKIFEAEMKANGWYMGAPWCAFFVRTIWSKCNQKVKYINGSAVRSYKALDESAEYEKSAVPKIGALVVWRSYKNGKPLSTGHVGIVTSVSSDSFETIEGNTTDKGGREGIMVATRIRHYEWNRVNGLRLLGFINPID
jgi:surface antigen